MHCQIADETRKTTEYPEFRSSSNSTDSLISGGHPSLSRFAILRFSLLVNNSPTNNPTIVNINNVVIVNRGFMNQVLAKYLDFPLAVGKREYRNLIITVGRIINVPFIRPGSNCS